MTGEGGSGKHAIFINGILATTLEDALANGDALSRLLDMSVVVVWNPSDNLVKDSAQTALVDKLNVPDASVQGAIRAIRAEIDRSGGALAVAHSQGAAILSAALSYLSEEERAKVDVLTFGGAAFKYPKGLHSLHVVVNVQDFVPWLAGYLSRTGLVGWAPGIDRVSFGGGRVWDLTATHGFLGYMAYEMQKKEERQAEEKRLSGRNRRQLLSLPHLGGP